MNGIDRNSGPTGPVILPSMYTGIDRKRYFKDSCSLVSDKNSVRLLWPCTSLLQMPTTTLFSCQLETQSPQPGSAPYAFIDITSAPHFQPNLASSAVEAGVCCCGKQCRCESRWPRGGSKRFRGTTSFSHRSQLEPSPPERYDAILLKKWTACLTNLVVQPTTACRSLTSFLLTLDQWFFNLFSPRLP